MSFIDRLRRFGGGALRGADAYCADRSDDVGEWLHYRVDRRGGVPSLFITGSCADPHLPELRDKLVEGIYISRLAKSRASGRKPPALSGIP